MVRSQDPERRTIAGLAAQAGVGVETVRFYQRKRLLRVPDCDGGFRRYGAEDVRRLRFIRAAQGAGFSLEEIAGLMQLDVIDDRGRARTIARARIAVLDERIAAMQAARTALVKLADQCASGGAGPCPILTAFERA